MEEDVASSAAVSSRSMIPSEADADDDALGASMAWIKCSPAPTAPPPPPPSPPDALLLLLLP